MFKLSIEQLKLIWNYYYTSLPIIILLCFLYKWFLTQSYPRKHLPPSPPRLPIIGNFHQLGTYPHRSLRSLSEIYGDLMMIYLGSSPTLIVSSAKAACEIMKIHDLNFCNRSIPKTVSKITYNRRDLAATQYGEYWKQMRSICVHQLLSNTRVRSFRSVREQEMNRMIDKIEKSCSSILNMREIFMHLTNDVLCRAAYGKTYSSMEGGVNFKELLKEFLEVMGALRVGDFIPWLDWTNWLDGWDARVEKIVKEFDFILEKIVDEHQHSRRESKNDEIVQDFVDVLLEVQKEKLVGFAIDRDNIKALVLDMFFAGTDSTYTLLEWVMTELLRHPKCMKILQNEVRAITRRKLYANEDDLEQMKYLKAVIKETLRLHPPIPLLAPRQSINDIKIKGYDIPVGVGVFINAWAIHRDPATWDEPDKFIPERFLNSPIDFRGQDFQFIPFGAGRRICPGITFAIAVNELVLANLMHKFDWTLPDGTDVENLDMSESIGITAHKKIALLAVATPMNAGK